MDDARWLSADEQRAWRAFQQLQMHLSAELAHDLAVHSKLSYPDYVVLVALTDPADGRIRPTDLARNLGWEQSRVSHQVSRMVARGLVVKERCPSDRRGSFVVITDKGRTEITAAAPSHVAAVRRLFVDVLTKRQLTALGATAEAVLAAWPADDDDR